MSDLPNTISARVPLCDRCGQQPGLHGIWMGTESGWKNVCADCRTDQEKALPGRPNAEE